jgi:nanoRNase/pAp phosphatase (c-di-AMP/oligoRNAs hydrolase)
MQIAVGHANPDFDAYAATVAATKLFPGAKGVFLGTQNTNVRAFHNLHESFLEFVDLRGLDRQSADHARYAGCGKNRGAGSGRDKAGS